MKVCRLRSLLMDIVDEKKQAMWTMNACTVCQQGGDCEKGVFKSNGANNESIEQVLRREDPDTFSFLEYSVYKALGLELCEANRHSNILNVKSYVLYFMRKYQDPQPEYTL